MLFEILGYMREKGQATAGEISSSLGFEESIVKMGLDDLCRKGRIERVVVKHVSCGCCGGGCTCTESEVFRYCLCQRDKAFKKWNH